MTQKYTTSDWQWFLQDIATQIDEQMKPDANEVERYQTTVGGGSTRRSNNEKRPSQADLKLSPRRSGSSSTRYTEEEGIEMPAVSPAVAASSSSRSRDEPTKQSHNKTSNRSSPLRQ